MKKSLLFHPYLKTRVEKQPDPLLKTIESIPQFKIYWLPDESWVAYYPNYFENEKDLVKEINEKVMLKESKIYGHATPREIGWIGEKDYAFSGQTQKADKFPPLIDKIQTDLNLWLGLRLNSVLINRYRKEKVFDENGKWVRGAGKDSISYHKDDEKVLNPLDPIVSLSIGQKRKFFIKHDETKQRLTFHLGEGDLLIMSPQTNKMCCHSIPKEILLKIESDRYNLTFRTIKE